MEQRELFREKYLDGSESKSIRICKQVKWLCLGVTNNKGTVTRDLWYWIARSSDNGNFYMYNSSASYIFNFGTCIWT